MSRTRRTDKGRAASVDARYLVSVVLVAAAYVAFAELGFSLAYATKQVTAVWPPTGIAVAVLVILGYRVWPGIFAGALVSNALSHEPLVTAGAIAAGNTLGPVIGVYLLRRVGRFDAALERVQDVLALVLLASMVGMTVTATNGVLNLAAAHIVPWSAFATTWRLWWTGDAMGVLLFAPLILTWWTPGRRPAVRWSSVLEGAALAVALVALCAIVFLSSAASGYSVYPVIIWSALRFRQRATALAVVAISAIAIWGSTHGLGPFSAGPLDARLSLLVTFMAMLAVSGMLLGAIIAERRKATAQSQAAERRFHLVAEAVPQMVWTADPTGWIDWHNERWYEYTGQQPSEAAGWGWQRAHHPNDYQRIMRQWPRSIATGDPFSMESRIRRHDGSYRWFLVRAEPVRDGAGAVARWYGTNTDVDDQKRQLQQTTRVAHTLQASFLPSRLPERADLQLDAIYLTAEQAAFVGGDWYDAFELPDGRVVISMGDVVGHGVAAAMSAARLRQSVFVTAFDCDDPATVLSKVNRLLAAQEATIATALVAFVSADLATMRFASAGHPPPVVGAPAVAPRMLACGGAPLGVDTGSSFDTTAVDLAPDSVVVFYSDGITEFKHDVLKAESALVDAVEGLVGVGPIAQPAIAVQRAVMGAHKPVDDAVLLVLRRSQVPVDGALDSPAGRKRWSFHSSDAYFAHAARHELMTFLRDCGSSDDDLSRCELIIGELLANTVQHAPGIVRLEVTFDGNRPVLTVSDAGPGLRRFEPELPDDELTENGRGLYLIGTLAENVRIDSTSSGGTTMTVALPTVGTARNGGRDDGPGGARDRARDETTSANLDRS